MAGGGVPYERWLLVQGGGGEIPCRYKPLTAICNHYNDKHHTQCINTCRKLHWGIQLASQACSAVRIKPFQKYKVEKGPRAFSPDGCQDQLEELPLRRLGAPL